MPTNRDAVSGRLYIGLMSGTSIDGIDAVLVQFDSPTPTILGHVYRPWPTETRNTLKALTQPGDNEIDRLGVADIEAANQFALAVTELLGQSGIDKQEIAGIGSHGQTIRHRPHASHPFTLQIGDPNQLAEKTGITVVADFRRRDMAANGEGAPLAPAFHAALLRSTAEMRVVLNLGGIANITVLPAEINKAVTGFDTGPANTLMDAWISRCQGRSFDENGGWATSGQVIHKVLEQLLDDDYFKQPPPKSTGPELFNLSWLERRIPDLLSYNPADIQATLCRLSSYSIIQAIIRHAPDCRRVICCGGGSYNPLLVQQLKRGLEDIPLETTAAYGIAPEKIEATAFAWLARQTLEARPGNLPAVTGASHPVILGGIYQA